MRGLMESMLDMTSFLRFCAVGLLAAFVIVACANPLSANNPVPPIGGEEYGGDDNDEETGAMPAPPLYFA
jgi:hypothetical protein